MLFLIFLLFVIGYIIINRINKKSTGNRLWRVFINIMILGALFVVVAILAFIIDIVFYLRYDEKDFDFSEEQLAFISAFKANDTMYFQNPKGMRDTFVVDSIVNDQNRQAGAFMVGPAYNNRTVKINRLSTMEDGMEFTIGTLPQAENRTFSVTWGTFHYYSDTMLGSYKDKLEINNRHLYDCHIIYTDNLGATNYTTDIVTIIWTKKDGPVAYETADGSYWVREL